MGTSGAYGNVKNDLTPMWSQFDARPKLDEAKSSRNPLPIHFSPLIQTDLRFQIILEV